MESSNSNSKERELQLTQRLVKQRHSHCISWFEQLETYLLDLYLNSSSHVVDAFKPAFHSFFGEEHQTFRLKMFHNLDQLRLQLERENLLEVNPRTCLDALQTLFKEFFASKRVNSLEHLNQCWQKDFKEYTLCEPDTYRRDLLENLDTLEAVIHRAGITYESENHNALSKSVNKTQLQQHKSLVTESTTLEANLNSDVKALDVGSAIINEVARQAICMIYKAAVQGLISHMLWMQISDQKLKGNSVDTKFAKPSILGKPVLQPPRNQSVVRQPNAFKSERPNFSKPRFASQVDVNNVLSKPVTPHYLPKVREYVLAKPHHVIAPGSSRNSQEEPYGSNDMAHNHYLEEARKKTQERNRNSKPSVMHTTSLQNTTNGSKPNPRSNNQISRSLPVSKSSCGMSNGVSLVDHSRNSSSFSDSKHFVCSTCHKCVFNANHDNCITKFLKEVNSRAKVQSPKTRNNNKPIEPKSQTQKPSRQMAIGQMFSLNKWTPTGKMFIDSTTKVDSEPPNGSNEDITNPYECNQALNVSASTLNLSAGLALQQHMASADNTSGPAAQRKERRLVPQPPSPTPNASPTKNDWDSLFCPMFDEYFNPSPSVIQHVLVAIVQEPVVSTITPLSTRIYQDTPSTSTSQTTQEEQFHVIPTSVEEDDHGIEVAHMDNDLKSTTRTHRKIDQGSLDKIIGDPSRLVSTRLLLQTKALFCYYDALLCSSEHKSYKDALTESCWIDTMKSSMSLNIWRFGS
ncbi:hypothetical protein Tco_1214716 [Tanacetum coccineum]